MLEEFTHVASLTVPARASSREQGSAENVPADTLRRNGEAGACRGGWAEAGGASMEMAGDVGSG